MPDGRVQKLAGGLVRGGVRHRVAVLVELDHEHRWQLLDGHAATLPAERATALLAATVAAIGTLTPVTEDDLRALSIGDRERVLLALARTWHGDTLPCTFPCACGEQLELDLPLAQLLADCELDEPTALTGTTSSGATVTVRGATGADHERAARTALSDPRAAREALLSACIVDVSPPEARDAGDVRAAAEALIAELDPAAEISLSGQCPACGARVSATLDPLAHVWHELERQRAALEAEVQLLALNYHWSEREIVALPAARRARYIAQLDPLLATR